MGKTLAENNIRLIYGGSNIGLMGIIDKVKLAKNQNAKK